MTAKFSASRRAAFLAALRATGNQTLAAERAKVSRSWVQAQRSADPAFKLAVAEAVALAKQALIRGQAERERGPALAGGSFDTLRMSGGSIRPAKGWGFLDGAELVIKGTGGAALGPVIGGGKRIQIARARVRQWTARVEARFMTALTACCNVRAACAEVGFSPASAYNHRQRWPGFARRWDQAVAIGYDQIECGLIAAAGAYLAGEEPPEVAPLSAMTFDHALQMLRMHQHQVHGRGKRPGLPARALPPMAEVDAEILHLVKVIERGRARGRG